MVLSSGSVMASETGRNDRDQANLKALGRIGREDRIDDILITLGRRMHLIRPLEASPMLCLCVALDSESANPLLARMQLRRVAQALRM